MSDRPRKCEVDMRTKEGKAGLTMRLAEKAEAKQRVFLPLYSVPQVKDLKR